MVAWMAAFVEPRESFAEPRESFAMWQPHGGVDGEAHDDSIFVRARMAA